MKKIVAFLLIFFVSVGLINVDISADEYDSAKPVIGIAWHENLDIEIYTDICTALELVGADYVLLPQVKSADLKYDKNGKLRKGVAKSGALTKKAGKLVRTNSWHGSNVEEAVSNVDAVIFPGGEDISPSLYFKQEDWHGIESEKDYNAERDVSDYLLMSYCLDMDIPVFGICRGGQMLGVVSGAEVIQDIPTYFEELGIEYNYVHRNEVTTPDAVRDFASHAIKISKDSILYDIIGKTKLAGCPSWHHQSLKSVDGTRLKVTGTINVNGVEMIEAFERTDKSLAFGVQFHPEIAVGRNYKKAENAGNYMSMKKALSLFGYFVDFAAENKQKTSDSTDIQYVLYLGTNDKDTNEPVFSQDEAKARVKEILLSSFGGYTIMEADGGWIDGDKVYKEYTLVIYLSDTTVEDVHMVAAELIKEFNQSSVMIQANPTKTEFFAMDD